MNFELSDAQQERTTRINHQLSLYLFLIFFNVLPLDEGTNEKLLGFLPVRNSLIAAFKVLNQKLKFQKSVRGDSALLYPKKRRVHRWQKPKGWHIPITISLYLTVQRYAMFGGGAGKLGEMRIRRHGAHVA